MIAVRLVSVGPDLVRAAGHLGAERHLRLAIAVEPEERAPTPYWNQRITSSRYSGSSGSPPWKPPMSVVHHGMPERPMFSPAGIWARSVSKVDVDVAGPDGGAVALASRPGGAAEGDDLVLARGAHAVVHAAGVVAAGSGSPPPVPDRRGSAALLGVAGADLGLAGVEPENADAEVVVVLPQLLPEVVAGGGVGRVVEGDRRSDRRALGPETPCGRAVPAPLRGAAPARASPDSSRERADRGPDRDHQPHVHLRELGDHRLRVGPLVRVELATRRGGASGRSRRRSPTAAARAPCTRGRPPAAPPVCGSAASHCQNPAAHAGSGGAWPVASA